MTGLIQWAEAQEGNCTIKATQMSCCGSLAERLADCLADRLPPLSSRSAPPQPVRHRPHPPLISLLPRAPLLVSLCRLSPLRTGHCCGLLVDASTDAMRSDPIRSPAVRSAHCSSAMTADLSASDRSLTHSRRGKKCSTTSGAGAAHAGGSDEPPSVSRPLGRPFGPLSHRLQRLAAGSSQSASAAASRSGITRDQPPNGRDSITRTEQ